MQFYKRRVIAGGAQQAIAGHPTTVGVMQASEHRALPSQAGVVSEWRNPYVSRCVMRMHLGNELIRRRQGAVGWQRTLREHD